MPPTSRIEPGQESVWDYPRPPRLEPSAQRIQVWFAGLLLADSCQTLRILETSHPPVYYIPQADIQMSCLSPMQRTSFCEFKGRASYWTVAVGEKLAPEAAWSYADPSPGYERIRDHLAFYPSRMERCLVDGELAQPQPGDFYGGWITSAIVGPFKGGPGTWGW